MNKRTANQNQNHPSQNSGIIRVEKRKSFTVLPNATLCDEKMSFGARGLLAYLLSKPDCWETNVKDLIKQSPAGRDAVYTLLRELQQFRYLERSRIRRDDGTFAWITKVYEEPFEQEDAAAQPHPAFPYMDELTEKSPVTAFPYMDEPEAENPDTVCPETDQPRIYKELRDQIPIEKKLTEEKTLSLSTEEKQLPKPKEKERERNFKNLNKKGGSQYSLETCFDYVQHLAASGTAVVSPQGLARTIYLDGSNDAFIARWISESIKTDEADSLPKRKFSDEPCTKCFGSKLEIVPGKGARPCVRCTDESGKRTGFEPAGNRDQNLEFVAAAEKSAD